MGTPGHQLTDQYSIEMSGRECVPVPGAVEWMEINPSALKSYWRGLHIVGNCTNASRVSQGSVGLQAQKCRDVA